MPWSDVYSSFFNLSINTIPEKTRGVFFFRKNSKKKKKPSAEVSAHKRPCIEMKEVLLPSQEIRKSLQNFKKRASCNFPQDW